MSSVPRPKNVLLVNPWIHDFAAYDFWMKPLGLLYLGGILRSKGFRILLLDCLEIKALPPEAGSGLKLPKQGDFGRGHFYKEPIPKPEPLRLIPRHFRRYGIPPPVLKKSISSFPRPDLILVTSSMTYWYTGVAETIAFLRLHWPGVPIWLGGIYATLLPDHARKHSGADRILPGPWDQKKVQALIEILETDWGWDDEGFPCWPYPVFDLYPVAIYPDVTVRRRSQEAVSAPTFPPHNALQQEERSVLRVAPKFVQGGNGRFRVGKNLQTDRYDGSGFGTFKKTIAFRK